MKTILCILDGFGIGDKTYKYNAIFQSKTPNSQRMLGQYSSTQLETSGIAVGLPEGQMGNSEVGHMTIGCGRVIYQDLPRINLSTKVALKCGFHKLKFHQSPFLQCTFHQPNFH